jgi:hypothetical protein
LFEIRLQPLSFVLAAAVTNSIIGKAFKCYVRMVSSHPAIERVASHAEGFHLRVLLEPDVTLARHPAPDVQPT